METDQICCYTGYSFLDAWTLAHFCFWVFMGSTVWAFKVPYKIAMPACLAASLVWEVFEHFMAPAYPNVWKDPESFWNAWISDPLTCIIGVSLIWWLLNTRKRRIQ
jgi:hypothetical protein